MDSFLYWRDIFQIICTHLDYRQLLTLNRVCKPLREIVTREIKKRENIISNTSSNNTIDSNNVKVKYFYSDASYWYLGRRCNGFVTIHRDLYEKAKIGRNIMVGSGLIGGEISSLRNLVNIQSDRNNIIRPEQVECHAAVDKEFVKTCVDVVKCSRWEEITLFGDRRLCRTCIKLKTVADRNEATCFHEYESRKRREEEARWRRSLPKVNGKNSSASNGGGMKFQPKNK